MSQTLLPVKEDVAEKFKECRKALTKVEKYLKPLLDMPLQDLIQQLQPEDNAKLHVSLADTLGSLYFVYLRAIGKDPVQHPLQEELQRVKQYIQKVSNATDGSTQTDPAVATPRPKLNLGVANRFIRGSLGGSEARLGGGGGDERAKVSSRVMLNGRSPSRADSSTDWNKDKVVFADDKKDDIKKNTAEKISSVTPTEVVEEVAVEVSSKKTKNKKRKVEKITAEETVVDAQASVSVPVDLTKVEEEKENPRSQIYWSTLVVTTKKKKKNKKKRAEHIIKEDENVVDVVPLQVPVQVVTESPKTSKTKKRKASEFFEDLVVNRDVENPTALKIVDDDKVKVSADVVVALQMGGKNGNETSSNKKKKKSKKGNKDMIEKSSTDVPDVEAKTEATSEKQEGIKKKRKQNASTKKKNRKARELAAKELAAKELAAKESAVDNNSTGEVEKIEQATNVGVSKKKKSKKKKQIDAMGAVEAAVAVEAVAAMETVEKKAEKKKQKKNKKEKEKD